MLYSELLDLLKPHGLEQVGRITLGEDGTVYIARPTEICFPYQFQNAPLYAPAGKTDWEVTRAEIRAIERRFNISVLDDAHPSCNIG